MATRDVFLNFRAGLCGDVRRPEKAPGKYAIFSQKSEWQMLSVDGMAAILTRFVACEENDAASFFSVAFEHDIREGTNAGGRAKPKTRSVYDPASWLRNGAH